MKVKAPKLLNRTQSTGELLAPQDTTKLTALAKDLLVVKFGLTQDRAKKLLGI
jgi:hypothetical protein